MNKNFLQEIQLTIKSLLTNKLLLETDCIPFAFKNVPRKKILNAIKVGLSTYVRPSKSWGRPVTLQIEPSSLCNLNCKMCAVGKGMERPVGLMDMTTFKSSIDAVADYLLLIILWDWGEPFLNPRVYDMIAYAKSKGIKVLSSTNAHVFAKKANAEKLIASGLDSIITAVDGITPDTYEDFRQSGSLELALQGIRNLVECKKAQRSQTPLINFRFIVTRKNEHELEEVKRLAVLLGVDALTIKTLNPYDIYKENRAKNMAAYHDLIPEDICYQRFEYTNIGEERVRINRDPTCTRFWDCMTVRWDGNISICTYDYKGRYLFGNINKDSLIDIWNSDSYRSMRRKFTSDWQDIEICQNCTNSFIGGSSKGETIIAVYYNNSVAELFSEPEQPAKIKPLPKF